MPAETSLWKFFPANPQHPGLEAHRQLQRAFLDAIKDEIFFLASRRPVR